MIRRAACCLCLSLVLGILYGRSLEWQFLACFLAFLAAMAAGAYRLREHVLPAAAARVFFCICLFAAGSVHMQDQQAVRDQLEAACSDGDDVTVQGKVRRKEQAPAQEGAFREKQPGGQFPAARQAIYYLTEAHVTAGGHTYPAYGVLVYSSDSQYQPGNVLKAAGRYASFQVSRNEGNFNEKQYRQSRKWEFKVYADAEELISGREDKYALFLGRLRETMRQVYADSMDAQDAGVMANIALGEKSLLDAQIRDLYRDAGISHILAVSGLHVSLLGMGLLSLLQRLGCPQKCRALLCAGFIFSFGVFSGMEVSTARAVGMFALMMAAQVLGRTYDSLTALSANAMLQLWENPFLLGYAGFLFSYGAALGVAAAFKIIGEAKKEEEKPRLQKKIRLKSLADTLRVSACIQLVTLPLSLYFYYEIPPYSVFLNACVLPFMGVLLSLGIFGGIFGSVMPFLGKSLLTPAGWLLGFYEALCRGSLRLPWAELLTGRPSVEAAVLYYVALVFCLYLIWLKKRKRYLAGAILALAVLLFAREKPQFEIDVLDVGQGDGIFIQNGNGEHFFIDGGSSNVKGVGNYRILPFLKYRGIRSVKGWIVSHADADHISGLSEVLAQGYPVEYLVLSKYMVRDEAMRRLLAEAGQAGCKVLYVAPGEKFGSGDMAFTVLAPGEGLGGGGVAEGGKKSADRNASSLSLLLRYRGFCGMFTGDISAEQEESLLASGCLKEYGIADVDFYKAAHHGSDYSNSLEFLEAVSPKMAAVSCARKNSYGHPGKKAVGRMREAGCRVFFTMDQGQIRVRPQERDLRVWTYLP